MRPPRITPLLLVLSAASAAAGGPEATLSVEDYFTLAVPLDVAAAPDGTAVAYTEARWDANADRMNVDLWVADVPKEVGDGAKPSPARRLTFDTAADTQPMWSSDGEHLYFLSGRSESGEEKPPLDGDTQVWRIDADGTNLTAVTRVPGGVEGAAMSPYGDALFLTTAREEVADAWKELRIEYKDLDYGHGVTKFSTLHRLDLNNWRLTDVLKSDRYIRTFDVGPAGPGKNAGVRIAMVTDPDRNLVTHEGRSRVDSLDVAPDGRVLGENGGEVRILTPEGWRADHPSPFGWIDAPAVSDDGVVAFTVAFDGYPAKLFFVDSEGSGGKEDGSLVEIPMRGDVTLVDGSVGWTPGGGKVAFLGDVHGRIRLHLVDDVTDETVIPRDVVVRSYDISPDGRVFAVLATPDSLDEVYEIGDDGEPTRLTDLNPQAADWPFPTVEIVKWTGADGDEVEGILELPPGYKKEDGPLPTIVQLHGGPTWATHYKREFRIYGRSLLPSHGYALFSPNYRGSTGYGEEFMVDLIGRENDVEVKDILAGIDALEERGIIDPAKLGVMGWSNGGFLTNALITRVNEDGSPIFAAASSGAGVLDQVIQWGTEDTPGHVVNYMKGLPWEAADEYQESSPVFALDRVKTPTLIHVGGDDPRVPPAHSKSLYRALRNYLNVPVELIVYPGEGHGLTTREHRAAKVKWDLAWFEKYVKGGE